MSKLPLVVCLMLMPVAPAVAQEAADTPPTLVLSNYQCDWNRLFDLGPEFQLIVPIWEELVAEGMMQSAGSFTHSWADEWNFGTYIIAENMDAAIAANDEANSRFAQQHPDANIFQEACRRHRDNFYEFGPVAASEGAPTDGNPTLVIGYWECDIGMVDNILEQYETNSIPALTDLISEGELRSAGSFVHSWADEWNLAFYWIAEDIPTFIGAWQEGNRRVGAANPDAPNLVFENCTAHRDGMYTLGPRTGMSEGGGN